jgi:hypothetical protein
MEWQLQTLALAPFGGPGGLLNQLLTEESQHLPCGEFYKRRSSRTGARHQRPQIAIFDEHVSIISANQEKRKILGLLTELKQIHGVL